MKEEKERGSFWCFLLFFSLLLLCLSLVNLWPGSERDQVYGFDVYPFHEFRSFRSSAAAAAAMKVKEEKMFSPFVTLVQTSATTTTTTSLYTIYTQWLYRVRFFQTYCYTHRSWKWLLNIHREQWPQYWENDDICIIECYSDGLKWIGRWLRFYRHTIC